MNYQLGREDIEKWIENENITSVEDVKTELR